MAAPHNCTSLSNPLPSRFGSHVRMDIPRRNREKHEQHKGVCAGLDARLVRLCW